MENLGLRQFLALEDVFERGVNPLCSLIHARPIEITEKSFSVAELFKMTNLVPFYETSQNFYDILLKELKRIDGATTLTTLTSRYLRIEDINVEAFRGVVEKEMTERYLPPPPLDFEWSRMYTHILYWFSYFFNLQVVAVDSGSSVGDSKNVNTGPVSVRLISPDGSAELLPFKYAVELLNTDTVCRLWSFRGQKWKSMVRIKQEKIREFQHAKVTMKKRRYIPY